MPPRGKGAALRTLAPFPVRASPVSRRLPHVPVHFPVPGKKTAAKAGILPETIIFAAVSGGRRAAGPLTGSSDFFLLLTQQIQDEKHPNQADSLLQALEPQRLVGLCEPAPPCNHRSPRRDDVDPLARDAKCVCAACRHGRRPPYAEDRRGRHIGQPDCPTRNVQSQTPLFDRKAQAAAPVQTLESALRLAPSVDIRERGGKGMQADIFIRGGSFDQTMVLLNGIDFTDARTGHQSHSLPVDLDCISAVDLLDGVPASGPTPGRSISARLPSGRPTCVSRARAASTATLMPTFRAP